MAGPWKADSTRKPPDPDRSGPRGGIRVFSHAVFQPLVGSHHPLPSAVETALRSQDGDAALWIHVAAVVRITVHRGEPPQRSGNRIRLALRHDHRDIPTLLQVEEAILQVVSREGQRQVLSLFVHSLIQSEHPHVLPHAEGAECHLRGLRVVVVPLCEGVQARQDGQPRNIRERIRTVRERPVRVVLGLVQILQQAAEESIRILCEFHSTSDATENRAREPCVTSSVPDAPTGAIHGTPRAHFVTGQVRRSERERVDRKTFSLRQLLVARGCSEDRLEADTLDTCEVIMLRALCFGAHFGPLNRLTLDDGFGQDRQEGNL